ncbi:MAG: GNAT family N-acetyltransferase [Planctomycetes bacterium]|nr:GNAT family N-acetyltransferase [Planctomycetota bacterium]
MTIRLVPIEREHLPEVWRWLTEDKNLPNDWVGWLDNGQPAHNYYHPMKLYESDEEEFERVLRDDFVHILAILSEDDLIGEAQMEIDPFWKNAELNFLLKAEARGKGNAGEILRTMLNKLFGQLGMYRVYIEAVETNERALKFYRKMGFVEEGRLRKKYPRPDGRKDAVVMSMLREEWEKKFLT